MGAPAIIAIPLRETPRPFVDNTADVIPVTVCVV